MCQSFQQCYVRATGTVSTSSGDNMNIGPRFGFLSNWHDVVLDQTVAWTVTNIRSITGGIAFDVSVNATAPFLFLELKNTAAVYDSYKKSSGVFVASETAGWFSDNNFLAEVGRVYSLTYSPYRNSLTVDDFKSRLQGRSLQHSQVCDLPLFTVV